MANYVPILIMITFRKRIRQILNTTKYFTALLYCLSVVKRLMIKAVRCKQWRATIYAAKAEHRVVVNSLPKYFAYF